MAIGKIELLFGFVVIFVIVDTFIADIGVDFSLVEIGVKVLFLIGALWTWVGIFFQRLVYLDVVTPFMFLVRLMFALLALLGGSAVDLLFDILRFLFGAVKDGFELVGISTEISLNIIGGYGSVDFATFTIRLGFAIDFLGNGVIGQMQISIFGTDPLVPTGTRFVFSELGVFGIESSVSLLFGGKTDTLGVLVSMEDAISSAFDAFFEDNGTLESLYQEMIDYLK